ncbi:MAG TPA: hypothetical protein QF772_08300, partial [Nitrospinaceae bacterium]|nr:hypothetical protein [Nitrospinaceae bacterium]
HIKHNVVREMLKHFKIKNGLEIHYDGDLPSRSGMGSSSVFLIFFEVDLAFCFSDSMLSLALFRRECQYPE